MFKTVRSLLFVVVVMSLLLAACGTPAAEAQVVEPTAATVATDAPVVSEPTVAATADPIAAPVPDARDLALPSTPVEQLDQMPAAKHFRARTSSHTWNQKVRLLAEITPQGRCARVVFLSCPDGLRGWLLASLGGWTFTPGRGSEGPIAAWVQLDGELEVEVSSLESEVLRVSRQSSYPRAAGGSAAARPPGV